MRIDLDNGHIDAYDFFLEAGSGSNEIIINSNADTYPLEIGDNFKVKWDGSLFAKNASLSGTIHSELGLLGGWYIGKTTLEGGGSYTYNSNDYCIFSLWSCSSRFNRSYLFGCYLFYPYHIWF